MAYAEHIVTLHAPIKVRRTMTIDGVERTGLVETTVGRIIFNNPVPQNLGYIDRTDPEHWLEYEVSFRVTKKTLPDIISRCMTRNGTASVQRCWMPSRRRATSTPLCLQSPSLCATL